MCMKLLKKDYHCKFLCQLVTPLHNKRFNKRPIISFQALLHQHNRDLFEITYRFYLKLVSYINKQVNR